MQSRKRIIICTLIEVFIVGGIGFFLGRAGLEITDFNFWALLVLIFTYGFIKRFTGD